MLFIKQSNIHNWWGRLWLLPPGETSSVAAMVPHRLIKEATSLITCPGANYVINNNSTVTSSPVGPSEWRALEKFTIRPRWRFTQSSSNWQSRCGVIAERRHRSARNAKGPSSSCGLIKDQRSRLKVISTCWLVFPELRDRAATPRPFWGATFKKGWTLRLQPAEINLVTVEVWSSSLLGGLRSF